MDVRSVADLLGITEYEVFERAYTAEYGGLISREDTACVDLNFRAYKRSQDLPQWVTRWCALHQQDPVEV